MGLWAAGPGLESRLSVSSVWVLNHWLQYLLLQSGWRNLLGFREGLKSNFKQYDQCAPFFSLPSRKPRKQSQDGLGCGVFFCFVLLFYKIEYGFFWQPPQTRLLVPCKHTRLRLSEAHGQTMASRITLHYIAPHLSWPHSPLFSLILTSADLVSQIKHQYCNPGLRLRHGTRGPKRSLQGGSWERASSLIKRNDMEEHVILLCWTHQICP